MKTIDEGDAHHVLKTLTNALPILQEMYDYDPRKYNVMTEVQQCKESIKIMHDVIAGIVK